MKVISVNNEIGIIGKPWIEDNDIEKQIDNFFEESPDNSYVYFQYLTIRDIERNKVLKALQQKGYEIINMSEELDEPMLKIKDTETSKENRKKRKTK